MPSVTASDTGFAFSESFALSTRRTSADTGTTFTELIVRRTARVLADTVSTPSDTIASRRFYSISDTGTTISDSYQRSIRLRATDTLVLTDQFVVKSQRVITSTGVTFSVSLVGGAGVQRTTTNQFDRIECTRKWSVTPNYAGWTIEAKRNYELEVV